MKKALLGAALALGLWGGAALAQSDETLKNCPPEGQASASTTEGADVSANVNCPSAVEQGTGGSGMQQDDSYSSTPADDRSDMSQQSDVNANSNDDLNSTDRQGIGGSDESGQLDTQPADKGQSSQTVIIEPQSQQPNYVAQPMADDKKDEESHADMRGVTVLLGGGVEGYTGDLAPRINPGPAWGVGVALKPTKAFGVELGYSGAINSIEGSSGFSSDDASVSDEADIIRNGGSAVATLGLTAAPVQPYLLGGIGIDRYNVRNASAGSFRDDTVGNVPLGLGLRTHAGNFTADLRGTYGVLFNQGFAPGEGNTNLADIGSETPTGRLGAALRLGATF